MISIHGYGYNDEAQQLIITKASEYLEYIIKGCKNFETVQVILNGVDLAKKVNHLSF